jgi:hypothetical protein
VLGNSEFEILMVRITLIIFFLLGSMVWVVFILRLLNGILSVVRVGGLGFEFAFGFVTEVTFVDAVLVGCATAGVGGFRIMAVQYCSILPFRILPLL